MNSFLASFTGLVLFTSSALASDIPACPHLEGRYHCPPLPTQPELIFSLTRSENAHGVNRYTFKYPNHPGAHVDASPTGVLDKESKTWAYCMNDELVYFSTDGTKGWIQQSFKDKSGAFVIKVRGAQFLRCSAFKELDHS